MINIKTLEINSQEFLVDNDLKKGFLKGSIWANLYKPYKFRVDSINNQSEEELAIFMLEVYTFASTELTLYYITHKNNKEALEMLKQVNIEKNKLCEYITNKYHALSHGVNDPTSYFGGKSNVGI